MPVSSPKTPPGRSESSTGVPASGAGPVRIVDLARELGLSIATVSRALNGSGSVRPEVAARIRTHAERRGYVANRFARSLRSRTRHFIGFCVPDMHNLAYSIAADACAQHVATSGHQLILAISGDDPRTELAALRSLAEARAGGIIVAPSADLTTESRTLLSGMRVVEFNRTAGLSTEQVLCDDEQGFADAARHLLDLGHESIGYIGTTDAVSNGRERLAGLRGELGRVGLALPDARVRLRPPTEQDGYRAARELLTVAARESGAPTALLVGSSNLSMGVALAVRQLGVRVPDDLSLIVYGDAQWGGLYDPALTTVTAPYRDMARSVADIVAGFVAPGAGERAVSGVVRHPTELVVRRSTAPPTLRSN